MTNKVVGLKPLKNSQYMISLENGQDLEVCEDIIVKYRLVVNKEINDNDLEKINKDIIFFHAYNLALKYCLVSQKSSHEIMNYLLKKDFSKNTISEIIEKLKKDKIIDDEKYSLLYTEYLVKKGYGKFYIKNKLEYLGFLNEYINKAIDNIDRHLYEESIVKIIGKQIKNYQKYDEKTRNIKLQRYLLQRGYEYDIIFSIISDKSC